ncbi:histidine phosphatase family containing protein [Ceratobasidium sp. AG-Ba]|nr:histidine phosphatase family containing protein [Ceratobasidium sp. AG-Ba]
MTSLDPTHLPDVGWKPHRTRGEALHEVPRAAAIPIRALPDLRFEQSYLMALKPFVHIQTEENKKPGARATVEKPAVEGTAIAEPLSLDIAVQGAGVTKYGEVERVEWGKIAWVTTRDQVLSPLIQGAVWGTASIFLGPLSKKLTLSLREMFVGPSQHRPPSDEPTRVVKGQDSMGWLRSWVRSLGGGMETNAAL